MSKILLNIQGQDVHLTTGEHGALVQAVVEEFVPHLTPDAEVIHINADSPGTVYWSRNAPQWLALDPALHDKLPDIALYSESRGQLFLIDTAANRGPINARRRADLEEIFSQAPAELVYFTVFSSRNSAVDQLDEIAWETRVWFADEPTHYIYFNGDILPTPY